MQGAHSPGIGLHRPLPLPNCITAVLPRVIILPPPRAPTPPSFLSQNFLVWDNTLLFSLWLHTHAEWGNFRESAAYQMRVRGKRLPLRSSCLPGPPPSSGGLSGLGLLAGEPRRPWGCWGGRQRPLAHKSSSWGFIRNFFPRNPPGRRWVTFSGFLPDSRSGPKFLAWHLGFCRFLLQPSLPTSSSVISPQTHRGLAT